MDKRQEQDAQLRERPTSEVQVTRLRALREQVRDQLSAELGLTAWSERGNGGRAGCGEWPDSSGETVVLESLLLTGGVPDEQWPTAVEVVTRTAQAAGFGVADPVVDRPGEHEVVLRGEWGSLLRFGTAVDATLSLATGCHLPESEL